jgi:hypothetical protein
MSAESRLLVLNWFYHGPGFSFQLQEGIWFNRQGTSANN